MEVLQLGNPLLREKSEPVAKVTPEIRQLVSDMFETMDKERGVGLAAPQVGKLLRLFVVT
ncbi:MAG TPA: peptide deformylase, partial [Candidatus Treponema faecavium]|nr:peptide deformylase [Candidatus Treponema faecavium]